MQYHIFIHLNDAVKNLDDLPKVFAVIVFYMKEINVICTIIWYNESTQFKNSQWDVYMILAVNFAHCVCNWSNY